MHVIIQNNFLTAKIALMGAELKSLYSIQETEYIWYSKPEYWGKSAPFLFPIVGKLRNHQTIIQDKRYEMHNHGFIQNQLFEVLEQNTSSVVLLSKSTQTTKSMYPFEYQFKVMYSLENTKLRTLIEILNPSEEEIYFNLGGHPAFNCPLHSNERFEDYSIFFEEPENFDSPKVEPDATLNFKIPVYRARNLVELPLYRELFSIDTVVIPESKSKRVWLKHQEGHGIEFAFPDFKTFSIWSPYDKEAPFVCLEPWVGYNDCQDATGQYIDKPDLIRLKSKEKIALHYDIIIHEKG